MTPAHPFPRDTPKRETTWRRSKIRARQAAVADGYSYIVDFPDIGTELAFAHARLEVNAVAHARWRNESAIWWIDSGRLAVADVFFLADNTGSMGPAIAQVKIDANAILSGLSLLIGDARYGAGYYRDFGAGDDPVLGIQAQILAVDDGGSSAITAINVWTAFGGGDIPESWFYGLHRLAVHDAATFRPGATKFVVVMGDSPSHDPICSLITGTVPGHADVHDITEPDLIAELVAAGIIVIGVSAPSGPGLDADPVPASTDYALCGELGSAGQMTRITAATGGSYFPVADVTEIIDAILAGVGAIG